MRIESIEVRTPFAVGTVNCYAIEDGALVLVDAGPAWEDAVEDLSRGLARIGRRIEDVELLLLTHQHADHAGGATNVKQRSGCAIAGHPSLVAALADAPAAAVAEADYQASLMRLHGVPPEVVEAAIEIEARFHRYIGSVEVDVPLAEGAVPGVARLEARARSGHGPTDLVFAADEDGFVFTGDHLLAAFPSIALIHRPAGTADPGERSSALLAYRRSLAATARDAAAEGLPGHGVSIPDTSVTAREWLRTHERRAARLAGRIGALPITTFELVQMLWRDPEPARTYIRLCEILGALDLLEDRGAIVSVREGREVRYLRAAEVST